MAHPDSDSAPVGVIGGPVRRHPLAAFYAVTFLVSWGYWIPVAVSGGGISHFPGLLGPMVAAFVVSAILDGSRGVRELTGRMLRWRVPLRWYMVALLPLVGAVLALGALWLIEGSLPTFEELSTMSGLPSFGWFAVLVMVLLINGYGEEVGWRGFAWPRLRQRHSMSRAALFLAIPWAVWHLPTFWIDTGLRGFEVAVIPGWLVGLVAGAVVLGWLYEQSGSSLLIVALFHASLNMASATTGTEGVPAIGVSIMIIAASIVILRHSPATRNSGTNV